MSSMCRPACVARVGYACEPISNRIRDNQVHKVMNTDSRFYGNGAIRYGAIVLAVVLPACGPRDDSSTVLVIQHPSQPDLAASRDNELTLFGGLPSRGDVAHWGRSRGSLLQHSYTPEGADFDCHLDAPGDRIVFASTRHSHTPNLYVKSVNGTAVTQLTSDPASDIQPVFSPDGQVVAFASDRTGNFDIWMIGIDGQQPIQVTDSPMDEVHPTWSPDGRTLAFSALPRQGGQWELWIAPAMEHSSATFLGYGVFPEWSPAGEMLLFQRARERGSRWYSIWTIEILEGEPRYPTEVAASADFAMISPSWSRDGRRIAYTTVATSVPQDPAFGVRFEASDIWTMDAEGGSRIRLTDGHTANFSPTWSPDGRVFFTSTRNGHENIWSVMPTPGGTESSMPVARNDTPAPMTPVGLSVGDGS